MRHPLSIRCATLAGGSVASIFMGALAGLGLFGVGLPIIALLSSVMVAFDASAGGVFMGLVWGFFAGSVAGFLFAWFYNKML